MLVKYLMTIHKNMHRIKNMREKDDHLTKEAPSNHSAIHRHRKPAESQETPKAAETIQIYDKHLYTKSHDFLGPAGLKSN